MPKNPLEDWGQTFAAGVVAATLPPLIGYTIRLFGTDMAPRVLGSDIAPWIVFLCSPIIVFACARWAVRVTHGSALVRATVVGLAPGVLLMWMIAKHYSITLHDWTGAFSPLAVLIWILLNLTCGVLASVLMRRPHVGNG